MQEFVRKFFSDIEVGLHTEIAKHDPFTNIKVILYNLIWQSFTKEEIQMGITTIGYLKSKEVTKFADILQIHSLFYFDIYLDINSNWI